MNRIILLGVMILSLVIACLLYVFGYIFSPITQQIVIHSDEPIGLERASKILLWSAAASFIAGIVAGGGVVDKYYTIWASFISIGILIFVILASVISTSMYFFTPMCC